jgi:outer membrane protein
MIDARPDVRAIGARRSTAEYGVALASAEWKPTFALTGNLQYQEDGLNNLLNAGNRSYAVGLALRVPLFATPAAMARKATAMAQVRQTEHGMQAAVDNSRLEVTSAYTAWLGAKEIVATQRKAVELARESLAIAQVSYENGVITSTELNDARQALLETDWELVQAQYAQIVAAAKARLAAGQ